MRLAACWKVVPLHPEVDPLSGDSVGTDLGLSDADRAALEWALRCAEQWGGEAIVVAAGDRRADPLLREGLAAGATAARRVQAATDLPSAAVAAALAAALRDVDVVVCGDASLDRGTGSVPAFLAAELGAAQALGLVALEPSVDEPGLVGAERRLDGGRRERVRVGARAVVSVEAGTARLRRAPLPAVLAAQSRPIDVLDAPAHPAPASQDTLVARGPYRPRPRALAGPDAAASARARVLALTGALSPRTPPEEVVLDAGAAADLILERLAAWGYHRANP